ncbi:E3 ubiquitin-protein ligase TRIM71-like isoform X1 [Acropora millepora]|uniref:E3 ubiquitin-protein ligase TRIM71-like isoform X1 n=1 Tax=Acropora millepora TaxID=45264 RepID=UPI001CF0D654|nr:E3 ubiquitin-protein ligase TRIM71-like isoform X1 [Acropora millepora]
MDVQQLFKRLTKEAECPLCLQTVKNPKTLPCLHSFCLECLDKLANFARRQLQTTIKCPVCQTSFPIPDTDTFANLPSSFHLNRLVDVLALHDSTVQVQKCNSCDENNPATSYCFVCQSFMCAPCFQYHQRFKATRGHRTASIDKLQAQDVQELIERPVVCSQQYHEDQALDFYCEDCKVLICLKCSIVSHNRHLVTDTQKAARGQNMEISKALAKLRAEIAWYKNEIKKQTELKDKNITEIMKAEKKMTDSVEEWIRDLREHKKKMKQKFREIYEAEQKQHETRLENLKLITTQLESLVERGRGVLERNISAEILQTNQTILQRCNELINARKPDRYKSPYVNYSVKKKFDNFGQILVTKTDSSMCLAEDGKYAVAYTPQCVDQHSAEYQVNGQLLSGSPFLVQIRQHRYQFSFKFGSTVQRVGEFAWISGIAVSDRTGTIAIADFGNKRIQLFSSEGNFQRQAHCVKVFDKTGLYIHDIGCEGSNDGQFQCPVGLVIDKYNQLIVCDMNNPRLQLFTLRGKFLSKLQGEWLNMSKLRPRHVAINLNDTLFVSSFRGNCIYVFH